MEAPAVDLTRVATVVRRHWYVLRRSPHRFFDLTVWPLLDVLLFGSLGAFVASEDTSGTTRAGVNYLLAGIVMFHVLYQVQIAVSTGFMEETWSRNVLNVLTTPLTELEYVLGLAAFGMAKLVFALGALAAMAFGFFGFELTSVGWALVPVSAILMLCGFALGMTVIGLILRYGQSAEILAWGLNFFVMALSGVFYPVAALPGPLQPVAAVLPSTQAFTALRQVLDGGALPWGRIGFGLLGGAIALALATAYCVRMLGVFRRRGFVTRFS